jgi:hypothetical protein
MRSLVGIVALLALHSDAGAKEDAARACLAPNDARIAGAQRDAAKATAAAFDDALKKKGLRHASLKRTIITLHEGLHEPARARNAGEKPRVPGEAFEGVVDGVKGRYVAGPVYWTGAASPPAEIELVEDGNGNVHRLERRPMSSRVTSFKVCACRPYHCGSGCPGCHTTVEIAYGPLPEGVTFKGPVEVSYELSSVALEYTEMCRVSCPP